MTSAASGDGAAPDPDRPGLDGPVLDVVGIGFGPSNLALAIAIEEHNERREADQAALTARFLERQPAFGWHRGMLLDGATMQVSFLKDLVTMRNPASDYSFLSYLHERERLAEFINHKTLFPLRLEFHDYLEWAASRVDHLVSYGRRVLGAEPVVVGGEVVAFDVTSEGSDGIRSVVRGRNLVVAVGLRPSLPPGVVLGERVWHNLDLLPRVRRMDPASDPRRFVVVGAGQSAAEAVAFLHDTFPSAEVCSVFARYGYAPSDDSPFANRIFDPAAVDTYFDADDDVKRMLFDYHRNTNYSVVDADLIEDLYRREYQERVKGQRRLHMRNASRIRSVDEAPEGLRVAIEDLPSGSVETLDADVIVYATGYQPGDVLALLGPAGDLVLRRADGAPVVHRDYRLALSMPGAAAIHVQGGTEHSHGISSSLLSNVAVRTGEILDSISARTVIEVDEPARTPASVATGVATGVGRCA